jgi:hypothetical protein
LRLGYPAEEVDELVRQARIMEPEFFPHEAAAPLLFSRLQTQWLRSATGSLTGLNYAALEPIARIIKIDLDETVLTNIQIMESHVLREFAERDRRSRTKHQVHG